MECELKHMVPSNTGHYKSTHLFQAPCCFLLLANGAQPYKNSLKYLWCHEVSNNLPLQRISENTPCHYNYRNISAFALGYLNLETGNGIKLRYLLALLSSQAGQDTKATVLICVLG